MHYPEAQLKELKDMLNSDIREIEESGYVFIYISELKLPKGCSPQKVEALLCPLPHSGYTSRLFFKTKIETVKSVNWNGQVLILGHLWHAFSYNNIQNMSLSKMVINHLRGLVA